MNKDKIKLVMQWCLPLDTTSEKLDELVEIFANEHKEAINYTRCSTELPVEDAKLLYGLLPEWTKKAPSGLHPTLYGTLTQEGDQAIVNKVKAILKKAIT